MLWTKWTHGHSFIAECKWKSSAFFTEAVKKFHPQSYQKKTKQKQHKKQQQKQQSMLPPSTSGWVIQS